MAKKKTKETKEKKCKITKRDSYVSDKEKKKEGNKFDRFCLHMHIERNNTVALNNSRYQIRVRLISPTTNILVLN